jgi:glycosyltransferase 2 family protein
VAATSTKTRPAWAWLRALSGVGILALLVWRLGTGPFLDGVRAVDPAALSLAVGIGVITTVCAAWRWHLVAAGLGVRLPLPAAVGSYYRSQFLNTVLPGGVLGDVHRAVRHGLDIGNVGLGVRAVVLERVAGQTVQAVIAVALLFVLPSPVRAYMPIATVGAVVAVVVVGLVARALAWRGSTRWVRLLRRAGQDIRDGLLTRRAGLGVVVASTVVVAGHLATFVVAARAAGAVAPLARLVPLTLLALLAMGLPLNVAGWGPREGVAAWAFGAAGLTATQGVAAAVTYGVLVFASSLPGLAVLVVRGVRREPVVREVDLPAREPVAIGRRA